MRFILTFLFATVYLSISAQVYILNDGQVIRWQKDSSFFSSESVKSFERLETEIRAIQFEERICIVDSLVASVNTNENGQIANCAIKYSVSSSHVNRILKELENCKFLPNQNLELLLKFAPKFVEPSVFELDKAPRLGTCRRLETNPNLTFDLACFNYIISSDLVWEWLGLIEDSNLEGFIGGKITFDKNGELKQIEFPNYCFNKELNDLIADRTHFSIKKGSKYQGQESGLTIEINTILPNSERRDTASILSQADEYFEYGNFEMALYNYTLANSLSSLDTTSLKRYGYSAYELGIPLHSEMWKGFFGSVSYNDIVKPVNEQGKVHLIKQTEPIKLPRFNDCSNQDTTNQFDCFSEELVKHIKSSDNIYLPYESKVDSLTTVVSFSINQYGDVMNVQLLQGSYYGNLNLKSLKIICRLAKFNPCAEDKIKCKSDFRVPIIFHKYPE